MRSKYAFKILFLLVLLGVLANCGGQGGKARYDLQPITEEQAVEQLNRSAQNPARAQVIADRVRNNRSANFNFTRFWNQLQQRNLVARLPQDQQNALLELHDQSCNDTDFDQFAQLILNMGAHYDYIIGEFRRCQNSLSPERTRDFILRMMTQFSQAERAPRARNRAQQARQSPQQQSAQQQSRPQAQTQRPSPIDPSDWEIWVQALGGEATRPNETLTPEERESLVSGFLVREILRAPHASWGLVICYVSEEDFQLVDQRLRSEGQAELAAQLANIYRNECTQF